MQYVLLKVITQYFELLILHSLVNNIHKFVNVRTNKYGANSRYLFMERFYVWAAATQLVERRTFAFERFWT